MLEEKVVVAKRDKTYLFRCLLLANFLQYLEAGAVPALLLQLSESFSMGPGKQGLLGGVVYLSLGIGGPFAGYLLRKYEHKTVISCAVAANMFFTVIWAFTPIGQTYSTNMFIAVRFLMGLCQCVICVFLPLWTNENAPKETRTAWMSYLQASVPFGIMMGYIIASILTSISNKNNACFGLLCWRWSFLIEVMLLTPLYLGLYFIPKEDIAVCVAGSARVIESPNENASHTTTVAVTESNMNSCENLTEAGGGKKISPLSSQRQDFAPRRDVETGSFTYKSPGRHTGHEEGAPTSSRRRPHMTPEERQQCSTLRQTAMSASMYDPLSTRYAFKKSCDNIASLDPSTDIFPALPGLRWEEDESIVQAAPTSATHTATHRVSQSPAAAAALVGHASHHKSAKVSRRSSPRYRSLDEANQSLEETDMSEKVLSLSNKTNSTEDDNRDTKLDTKGKRKPLASGNRVRTSLMLDANGQVVHSSSRRDRDRERGSRRESSSALRGGSRRLSLQEWILGSLPALPAMPYTRSAEEESQALLEDPLSSASYGSVHGTDDPLGRTDNRVRRSLDYSFKRSSKALDAINRRSSTSAAVGSSSSSKRSGEFEQKSLPRKPKADTVQYESFRELTRQNTFNNNNRSSWGVFSMLGYNRDRSRSNSGGTGSELPILVPFSKSDRSNRQDGLSPNPKRAQRGPSLSPADKHTRSYSSGDIDVDFSRFDELETPPPHALHRTRSRTMSNPVAADPRALFSRSAEEREREKDRLDRFGKISESEGGESSKSGYVDAQDLEERGERKAGEVEVEEEEEVDEYESEEEDNYSVSYDEMSYSDSDTESDEEWPGLTPPPPLRSHSASHSTHQRVTSRDFESPPSSATRHNMGSASASKGAARRTPGTFGVSPPPGAAVHAAEEPTDEGLYERTSRSLGRAQRYLKSAYDTVRALLSIKTYRYLLGAMSALYFTVTGVQFWGTKYLTVALHAPLPLVSTLFILCAATGPTLGVFFGGWVVDRLGGYKGAHQRVVALELCATFGVLAFVFSLPLTFLNNIFAVVGLLWVVLLFGGAMLPACSGIVVSIIPRAYRPTSSSLALMVFNMFGYFMSLLLSGMLMQVLEEHRDVCDEVCALTWGFRLVLFWSVISLFFLLKALGASYQHLKDRDRGRSLRRRGSNRYSLRRDQV